MTIKEQRQSTVRVIKNNYDKRRCICENCRSVLEYSTGDVRSEQTSMNEYQDFITCPACGKDTRVTNAPKNINFI